MPDLQEYHALCGVRDAKLLCHGLPHHPYDPVASVDDERDRIPLRTRHFPVYEEVLQLPDPRGAERPEPVACPPASDCERQLEPGRRNPHFPTSAHPLPLTCGGVDQVLRPNHHPLGSELDLTRDRQRNRADVPISAVPRPMPTVCGSTPK